MGQRHVFQLCSLTISLLIVIGAILAAIPSAGVQAQMSLPECPDDLSGQSVFPSPRFEQDATLFGFLEVHYGVVKITEKLGYRYISIRRILFQSTSGSFKWLPIQATGA